jgi:hypothetical protein
LVGLLILGTIFVSVPLAIAKATDLYLAPTALSIFLPIFLVNIFGFNPFAAASGRAIYPILSRVFLELPIPRLLEIYIEQFFDVFEWYVVGSAAFRWHMLWISN